MSDTLGIFIINEVVVGTAAAAIIALFAWFFKGIVYPKIIEKINNIALLRGQWQFFSPKEASDGESIEHHSTTKIDIKQKGRILGGEARIEYESNTKTRVFSITGEIRESFVMMYFTSKNEAGGYQTFLLQHPDKNEMRGAMSFYGPLEGRIRSIDCTLEKCR